MDHFSVSILDNHDMVVPTLRLEKWSEYIGGDIFQRALRWKELQVPLVSLVSAIFLHEGKLFTFVNTSFSICGHLRILSSMLQIPGCLANSE